MNNRDCAMSILETHREARAWDDNAVAADLLNQLGLDPKADAKNPKPVVDPDEAEVAMAEAHAKEATEKAQAARAKLDAKSGKGGKQAKPDAVTASAETKVVLPPPAQPPSPTQATQGKPVGGKS